MPSMARTPAEKEAEARRLEDGPDGQDTYPWGLEISLTDIELGKMGNPDMQVGQAVDLSGVASVESISEEEEGGQMRKRIRLQITDLDVSARARTDAERADRMFGGDNGQA